MGVNLFVKRFHAFSGEGAGVGDWASGKAVDDAAWGKFLFKVGFFRVVGVFRFFFCIEVVEVSEKLIEAVCGGKHFIAIAEVVFAELAGLVATGAEESGKSGIFFFEAFGGTWKADFGESRANWGLSGDESGTTGGAALLAVPVGEESALAGESVDVRGLVSHHAEVVGTDVELADIVAPDDKNIWGASFFS